MDLENAENLTDEDPPPILSPVIREVFHVFANLLDIKSFMKLAMTSKEMYERCMEDKKIQMNIKEKECSVSVVNGELQFSFDSFDVSAKNNKKYLEKIRQLKCNVSLERIDFQGDQETDANTITEARHYLEELGVKNIDSLKIDGVFTGWHQISFFKDFQVKDIEINDGLPYDPTDVLHSLFQLNLDSFSHSGRLPIHSSELLPVDSSSVEKIKLESMDFDDEDFTQILWKIQAGSMNKLVLYFHDVPWDDYTSVGPYHDGQLPDDRPLLIKEFEGDFGDDFKVILDCWFLHWNGAVTKCIDQKEYLMVEFSKCDPDDYESLPPLLRPKEQVHKAIAEKSEIECNRSHFTSFFDGIPMVDVTHEGPLPEGLPLIFKFEFEDLGWLQYLINEDDSIDIYSWGKGKWMWKKYDLEMDSPTLIVPAGCHFPLAKYLLKKRIEKPVKEGWFQLGESGNFRCLFEDYETLPHDFIGILPEHRPLIFDSALAADCRVIVYEDGTAIQYVRPDSSTIVHIGSCPAWNLPSIMITPELITNIILEAPYKTFIYHIDYGVFYSSFDAFADAPNERPLVFEEIEGIHGDIVVETRWIVLKNGDVRKCQWKEGRATFTRGDPKVYPPALAKFLVAEFFKGNTVNNDLGFYIDRHDLSQCLKFCEILPFDYAGTLPDQRRLVFKKVERKHSCQGNPNDVCECTEEVLHIHFVSEDKGVLHITWGEDRFLSFSNFSDPNEMPPVLLKSKDHLEFLLTLPEGPEEDVQL